MNYHSIVVVIIPRLSLYFILKWHAVYRIPCRAACPFGITIFKRKSILNSKERSQLPSIMVHECPTTLAIIPRPDIKYLKTKMMKKFTPKKSIK